MKCSSILWTNVTLAIGYSVVLILMGRRMINTLETQLGILGFHVVVLFLLGAYHRGTPVGSQYEISTAAVILLGILLLAANFFSTLSTLV